MAPLCDPGRLPLSPLNPNCSDYPRATISVNNCTTAICAESPARRSDGGSSATRPLADNDDDDDGDDLQSGVLYGVQLSPDHYRRTYNNEARGCSLCGSDGDTSSSRSSSSPSVDFRSSDYCFLNHGRVLRSPHSHNSTKALEALLSTYLLSPLVVDSYVQKLLKEISVVHLLPCQIPLGFDNCTCISCSNHDIDHGIAHKTTSLRMRDDAKCKETCKDAMNYKRPHNLSHLEIPPSPSQDPDGIAAIIDRAWHYHNVGEPLSPFTRITLWNHSSSISPSSISAPFSYWGRWLKHFMESLLGKRSCILQSFWPSVRAE